MTVDLLALPRTAQGEARAKVGEGLRYHPFLDGLRGVAALMVVVFHFFDLHYSQNAVVLKFTNLGRYGVDLFFILSGFLITRILLHTPFERSAVVSFYMRRTLRIWPAYFFGLFLYAVVQPLMMQRGIAPLSEQIWGLLFLPNVPETFRWLKSSAPTHFWSLAVEEHFYLVWPIIVLTCARRTVVLIALGAIALSMLLRGVFLSAGLEIYYFTVTRLDGLACGALVSALMEMGIGKGPRSGRIKVAVRVGAGAALAVLAGLYVCAAGSGAFWLQVLKYALAPVGFACLVFGWLICDGRSTSARMLSTKPLVWLGKVSYGVYLYHPFCIGAVATFVPVENRLVLLMLSALLTLSAAGMSYAYLEAPFLRLKDRWR